jgi:protein-tyrosine phosphatase
VRINPVSKKREKPSEKKARLAAQANRDDLAAQFETGVVSEIKQAKESKMALLRQSRKENSVKSGKVRPTSGKQSKPAHLLRQIDFEREQRVLKKASSRIRHAEKVENKRRHCLYCLPRTMLFKVDKWMGEDGFDSPSYIPDTNIYLGGAGEAKDYALLKHLGITHVLNTAIQLPNTYKDHFIYYNIAIVDSVHVSIYKHLEGAATFLEHVHAVGGRVLVHCIAGICRSTSCVLAYLMKSHGMSLRAATMHVKRQRWIIEPNPTFQRDLESYEAQIRARPEGDRKAMGPIGKELWNAAKEGLEEDGSRKESSTTDDITHSKREKFKMGREENQSANF